MLKCVTCTKNKIIVSVLLCLGTKPSCIGNWLRASGREIN